VNKRACVYIYSYTGTRLKTIFFCRLRLYILYTLLQPLLFGFEPTSFGSGGGRQFEFTLNTYCIELYFYAKPSHVRAATLKIRKQYAADSSRRRPARMFQLRNTVYRTIRPPEREEQYVDSTAC